MIYTKGAFSPTTNPANHYSLGFATYNGSKYAIVRTSHRDPGGKAIHLEVVARIIRGGKSLPLTPKDERADRSKSEKVLVHPPVNLGSPITDWQILEPSAAEALVFKTSIYHVVEILKPDEAMRVARGIISSQTFYSRDKAFATGDFHNLDKLDLPFASKFL